MNNPLCATPIEQLRQLFRDCIGSFWLEDVRFATGVIKQADVIAIGAGWLQIRETGSDFITWINSNHIVSLNIVEG